MIGMSLDSLRTIFCMYLEAFGEDFANEIRNSPSYMMNNPKKSIDFLQTDLRMDQSAMKEVFSCSFAQRHQYWTERNNFLSNKGIDIAEMLSSQRMEAVKWAKRLGWPKERWNKKIQVEFTELSSSEE